MTSNYQIYYYTSIKGTNPVKKFLDSLQKIQKAKVFRIFKVYQQYGLTSIIPHTNSNNFFSSNIRIYPACPPLEGVKPKEEFWNEGW